MDTMALTIESHVNLGICRCVAWPLLLQVAMEKGLSPQQAAQALTEEALSAHSVTPATRDNITVLVVQFAPMPAYAV